MPTPMATVVVPVYNTACWLQEALDSIDQQECRSDLEVILVDDGSTDESPQISQRYARSAPAARYVRQQNAGLGAARNHGMRLATGRYLAFLDSDDIYPPRALDTLIQTAEAEQADIAIGDLQGFPPRPSPIWRREIIIGPRVIRSLDEAPDIVGSPSACNKMFRRELVERHRATFSEGTAFEDVLFTLPLMLRADRIALTPQLVYLYRQRGDGSSIMDNRDEPIKILQHLTVVERLATECTEAGVGSRYAVQRWIAYMQLSYAWRAVKYLDDQQLSDFTKRMFALFRDIPVEVTAEYVKNLDVGLRAVALYEEDEAMFRAPRWSGPLRVSAGQVYVGHPASARYRDLLRAHPFSAMFDLRPGDHGSRDTVSVVGTCFLAGVSVEPGEVRSDLVLEIGDALVRRLITVTKKANNQFDWMCKVPLAEIGNGRHALRLVVRDRGAEVPVHAAASSGRVGSVVNWDQKRLWIEFTPDGVYVVMTSQAKGTPNPQPPVRLTRQIPLTWRVYRALRRRAGRPVKYLLAQLGLQKPSRR